MLHKHNHRQSACPKILPATAPVLQLILHGQTARDWNQCPGATIHLQVVSCRIGALKDKRKGGRQDHNTEEALFSLVISDWIPSLGEMNCATHIWASAWCWVAPYWLCHTRDQGIISETSPNLGHPKAASYIREAHRPHPQKSDYLPQISLYTIKAWYKVHWNWWKCSH